MFNFREIAIKQLVAFSCSLNLPLLVLNFEWKTRKLLLLLNCKCFCSCQDFSALPLRCCKSASGSQAFLFSGLLLLRHPLLSNRKGPKWCAPSILLLINDESPSSVPTTLPHVDIWSQRDKEGGLSLSLHVHSFILIKLTWEAGKGDFHHHIVRYNWFNETRPLQFIYLFIYFFQDLSLHFECLISLVCICSVFFIFTKKTVDALFKSVKVMLSVLGSVSGDG